MISNRLRRAALVTAVLLAIAMTAIGLLIVVEAVFYLLNLGPLTIEWPALANRMDTARLGQTWVTVASIAMTAAGLVVLVLGVARRRRRAVPLATAPQVTATLDAVDARAAVVAAAESVPAVGGTSLRWTKRRGIKIRLRFHPSASAPGPEVETLVEQRIVAALERLDAEPAGGVRVTRARRSR